MTSLKEPLLEVENLQKFFPVKSGFFSKTTKYVRAVDDVSFKVYPGETIGIVGESGCGKSTLAKTLIRLVEPTGGKISYDNKDISKIKQKKINDFREDVQIIFQDPYSSLDPRKTVKKILEEPLINLTTYNKKEREELIISALKDVGLDIQHLYRLPHEFSGGQRQRIGIARALTIRPKLLICDEAVSALDVSIQAQTINLLKDLQVKYNLTYIFISHDLGVVKHFCDRVIVMYLGKVMETANKKELFTQPSHPYTEALLSAVPSIHAKPNRIKLKGEIPSPINPPSGCLFHTRCPIAQEICKEKVPQEREVQKNQKVFCHFR